MVQVESFVDEWQYECPAYKATGWWRVGTAAGHTRAVEDFHVAHDRPKQLYAWALVKQGT